MFFSFFYRNLFISVQQWYTIVYMSAISLGMKFILYPVRITRIFHRVWHKILQILLICIGMRRFKPSKYEELDAKFGNYDLHVKKISVSYYFSQVADQYSLVTFVVMLMIIRVFWNLDIYQSSMFSNLPDGQLKILLINMTCIFLFEFFSELLIRFICRKVVGFNILRHGNRSVGLFENTTTLFLYSAFMLHFLQDIYYSLQRGHVP
jgi:hypothetical protein